ncbi:hypothetical protein [Ideonella oryzae]|uniref:Uncharacterized protein n=1 Tax=Ideonella oryzae TaxID=2937441 RepID=A0ABT1BH69_9BURK|nr:hypothetical protein [Ideonella oryzae]MCO5975570.1 hypothetical protein [Ideonella oryzae]
MTPLLQRIPGLRSAGTLAGLGLLLSLAACGGGGGSDSSDTAEADQAQSLSATATTSPQETAQVADAVVDTALAVDPGSLSTPTSTLVHAAAAGTAQLQGSVDCAGGGTASVVMTGPTLAGLLDGVPEAGEVTQLTYSACSGPDAQVVLNGTVTMTVTQADSGGLTVSLDTSDLQAGLPLSTLGWSGSLSLTRSGSVADSGASTTSSAWSASGLSLVAVRNGHEADLSFNGSGTRTVQWQDGVPQSSSYQGSSSLGLASSRWNGTLDVATQGAMVFDPEGVPQSGSVSLSLGLYQWTATLADGTATVTVDRNGDGVVDRTRSWPVADWLASAAQ